MKWKSVGVYLGIAVSVMLLIGIGVVRAQTRTVSWNPVTTYAPDNSLIETGNTVSYSIFRQDNVTKTTVQLANHILATSVPFDDSSLVKGRVYLFTAQAHLLNGGDSAISPPYSWTVPLGQANYPAGLGVN
jgi:hypothetical protein